jgi:molybdopterin adenylyltransferase
VAVARDRDEVLELTELHGWTLEVASERAARCEATSKLRAIRTAVLTISTSVSRREAEDLSGPALAAAAEAAGCEVVAMEVVPDDFGLIEDRLHHFVDSGADLIFTTGGTGLTPDDITPEATRAVIDREAPGFAEAMRMEGARHTPLGILTRGVSGIAGRTLIVNFPGSPKAIDQLFGVLAPTLGHVVQTLRGDSSHHGRRR